MYRNESWVVMDTTMTFLEGFHHRISIRIVGMMARRGDGGEWKWASVEMTLEVTGILPIWEYLWRRQAKIAEYVTGRPIYEMCTYPRMMEVSIRFLRWWEQEHGPTQAEGKLG